MILLEIQLHSSLWFYLPNVLNGVICGNRTEWCISTVKIGIPLGSYGARCARLEWLYKDYGARCARLEQLYLEIHDISARFQIDFRQDSIKLTIWFWKFKPTSNNFKPGTYMKLWTVVYSPTLLYNRSRVKTSYSILFIPEKWYKNLNQH